MKYIVIFVMIFLFVYKFFLIKNKYMLVAINPVTIYASEDDAAKWPHVKGIATLESNQKLQIIACIDIKSYLIYKVNLLDKNIGYILDGDYHILKNGKKADCLQ